MIHPDIELRYIDDVMGFGVFATRFIPRGTVTWVRDDLDQVIAPIRVTSLPPPYRSLLDRYTFRNAAGYHILCWDLGRYMNHSCTPTCLGLDDEFEVAVRDLYPGDELTDDYATLYLQEHESFSCLCGSLACRGRVTPQDAAIQTALWREELAAALEHLPQVAQPLGPLLERRAGKPERVGQG
jgi:hypothetical protein